ncbi:MAG: heavy metal translocating P-type ATPase [Mesorhizobium sp.]|nr:MULTISPECIES: heavy metal translocating P-type ATPase [unclassified Mesorhizobium]RUV74875.1 heavy metal translocating P-type ATPase [Mesorhizobium sp. M5C.F.Cr.IN.023.01.1.1]RWF88713.1 MAG: heavy metal translocating P-type ATPase [Mesorhizobium sp.]RWF92967.1 MAG: heavy metal translocating P-type ATPase [Mesorhizobium sp.]RWI41519.1 MAG: heavy metal translocating P-type ATPase [Mesorhizobium sp.]RWI49827.1 MAG: heavy metal translocating P-type ATPase [Mesorhizobium sp.]
MRVLNEPLLRRALLGLALVGLAVGLGVWRFGHGEVEPRLIWAAATIPVVTVLALSIIRDFWIGRLGVDAIALISMSAALVLGEALAAIVVAIMYAGGTVLEDFARGRAERNLTALADRSPRVAHRSGGDRLDTVPVEQIAVGDALLVRAGELIPVDGLLTDPLALIDESTVTGEPLPERRREGDVLRSGTVNAGEAFSMRATAAAAQSTYATIVRMVAAAQTAKAPFIRVADRFAIFMLPATLMIAGLAWYSSGDPIRALAVLVVVTPCPLILAAPVAFIGGISRAARAGVIMKGSAALEALANVRIAVFDKTGTLTLGGAELIDIDIAPGRNADELLRLLASLEQASHHVIGDSIIRLAREKGLSLSHPENVREVRGSGLQGIVDGTPVRAGSRSLVVGDQQLPGWSAGGEARYSGQPVLRVFVAADGRLAGVFTFGDSLRGDAREMIRSLRSAGVSHLVMLTGDDTGTAARVASALGIDCVIADASPADKVAAVEAEKRHGTTMMVGDGINDAPALATATVGVALGARGATASSEAADVIVLPNRLRPVADAVSIAQRTRAIAMQSIVAGLVLSGGGMIAAAFGFITPVAGALLQELIDVAVILNALRTLHDKGFEY